MNFGQAFLFLFACATLGGVEGKGGTRGLATSIAKADRYNSSFSEKLGACEKGAVCGMWGDPHVITCDGYGYDCNRFGVFTIMKNPLYNIQGHFIPVRSEDLRNVINRGKAPRATYATDLGVHIPERGAATPTFQFSFVEYIDPDKPLSEHNCARYTEWTPRLDVGDVVADNIEDCRKRCLAYVGCVKFDFTYKSKQCRFAGEDAKYAHVDSNNDVIVAGHVDRCGTGYEGRGEKDLFAMSFGNGIKYKQENICQVLYYQDRVKQDISGKSTPIDGPGDFLYGNATSDVFVQVYNRNKIKIVTRTLKGHTSEIMIETAGKGPGESFGCHWNIWVCLPEGEKDDFASSVGLMGSADGNKTNDWITPDGTILDQQHPQEDGGFNYCKDWCVPQNETFISPPDGASYNEMKCHGEKYVDIDDESCEYDKTAQDETCGSIDSQILQHNCKLECCLGECANDTVVEIETDFPNMVQLLGKKEEEAEHNAPFVSCEDNFDSVCPGSSIVEVLRNTQDTLPVAKIYDIEFLESDDKLGKQVTFRVSHNLEDKNVDMYVRHQKKVGVYANDPVCHTEREVEPGCTETTVTAGCVEHASDLSSFAIVDVYLASIHVKEDDGTEVQKCCHPEVYANGVNVVKYTFKIQCECPSDTTG